MKRDQRIDLVKIIAAVMIVVLHIVEPGGGMLQQYVYLLGTFGIPLFLAANGYLMYYRDLTWSCFCSKAIKYTRFVLLWVGLLWLLKAALLHDFALFSLLSGAFLGSGFLFHLWFLFGLILIMAICCGCNTVLMRRGKSVQSILSVKMMVVFAVLMGISFLVDQCVLQSRMRDIVPAPFRLVTNGGYFCFGMYIGKCHSDAQQKQKPFVWFAVAPAMYGCICVLSVLLSIRWASSFYPCILCMLGVVSVMLGCLRLKQKQTIFWRAIQMIAPASVGVWVLHPLVRSACYKILEWGGVEMTLPLRLLLLPLILCGSTAISLVALRIKLVRRLFQI